MKRRIPENAFEIYQSMGEERSYEALADRLGVTKRAVTKAAAREQWQERLSSIQARAREAADQASVDVRKEAAERHLKVARFIQSRSIEALKSMPIESAMDGIRAYGMAVNMERLVLGEPTDRTALTVEEVTKREIALLLLKPGEREPAIQTLESKVRGVSGEKASLEEEPES